MLVKSGIQEILLVESGIPGIQLKESGILLMIGVWNPVPSIRNPGVESRIQDCLGFPYMRQGKYGDLSPEMLTTPENNITYHNALCLSPQKFE